MINNDSFLLESDDKSKVINVIYLMYNIFMVQISHKRFKWTKAIPVGCYADRMLQRLSIL